MSDLEKNDFNDNAEKSSVYDTDTLSTQTNQPTPPPNKPKKKKSSASKIALVLIIVFAALFLVIGIAGANEESSAYNNVDSINGNYAQKGSSGLYFEFKDSNSKFTMYTIKNNKITDKQTGTYYYDLDGKKKLEFYWDDEDSSEESYKVSKLTENSFTLDINSDEEAHFYKVKKSSKKAAKIQELKDNYEKEVADKEAAEKEKTAPKEVTFGSGNYTCGTDFNPGRYNITLISGSGNVSCIDAGLNEIFGSDSEYGEITTYNNALFTKYEVLEVSGGVQIRMTPSANQN